jgi:hypothetical protein
MMVMDSPHPLSEKWRHEAELYERRGLINPAAMARSFEIVRIATGKGRKGDDAFSKILVKVRNNASYHYYQPKVLLAGFREFFYKSAKNLGNEWALASLGNNMDKHVSTSLMPLCKPH